MRPLFMTEGQIADAVFGRGKLELWRIMAAALERHGLPPRQRLAGDRRYWPAVKAYLDRRNGLGGPEHDPHEAVEIPEDWK